MVEAQGEVLPMEELELGLQQSVPGTDNNLVREFIAGNDAAFTSLVTKYKDALTNYLNLMVGNYDVAADLAQETFLRVYRTSAGTATSSFPGFTASRPTWPSMRCAIARARPGVLQQRLGQQPDE
jgi:hypothetical protein